MQAAQKQQTHFERLEESLSFMSLRACHANAAFNQSANRPEVCIEHIWMNQMVAKATVPLMQEVVKCAEKIPDDPVSAPLIKYIKKHIAEETDHDLWYAEDLAILGVSEEMINARMPSSNIATLVGSQYYWVRHHHPVAFMGYLACLEVYHPTIDYVENLINKSGLPAEGFSTLMKHAEIDVAHREDIINTINTLPLTETQFRVIESSAFQTFRYVALIMEEVCRFES